MDDSDRTPLSERERRLPTFSEERSATVPLGNGENWFLPLPTLAFKMILDENGEPQTRRTASRKSFAAVEFANYLELLDSAERDDEYLKSITVLAIRLLRQNYRIDDDEIGDLFVFEIEEDGFPLYRAINDAIFGRSPKPSPDGSAPPS